MKGSADSITSSDTRAGCGSSIWNHCPGACGTPGSHRAPEITFAAAAGLWLAVSFHSAALVNGAGIVGSSSANVHGCGRLDSLRTTATVRVPSTT